MGSSLFWYENWTGLGALYFLVPQDFGIDENVHNVHDVTLDGEWDVDRLFEILPEDLAVHILEKIKPPSTMQVLDRPCWMLETRGYFSVKSAWEYTRRRDEPRTAYRMIWPDEESLQHLFFRSKTAKTTWKYFLSRVGIVVEGLTLHQAITKCWTANVCLRLKALMQALPSSVVWELWKRRNSMKYGDAVTTSRVIYQVLSNLQALVKVRKPGMDMVPHKWQDLLAMMENFTPKLKVTKVMWEFPSAGWLKVNTDGVSRGNPGRSSIGFCIRNENGDIVKSVGKEIEETTNTVAEAKAMVEALRFCRFQQYSHVDKMMQLMNGGNYTVTHIHREGNKLADHLANYALDHGEIECQQFWHLDAQGRRLVNEDKLQCPNLRVKGYGNIKMIDPNFEHDKKQMALETQLACATNMFSRKPGNKGQCFILSHASIQFGLNNLLICIQDLMWKDWQTTHAGEQRNQKESNGKVECTWKVI
uniref:RNase H type-1 domain-containing protein n=1 Tax=Nicotiana tabacum TaxID=4097 RepID=A0A1S4BUT3_TOBAC|nr:PREDICTED: uncharacterized protein LOC107812069 [Nicotiana tabacum]